MSGTISQVKRGKILEALLLEKNGTDFLKIYWLLIVYQVLSSHNLISLSRILASYWHLGVCLCKMYANVHLHICMHAWRFVSICLP